MCAVLSIRSNHITGSTSLASLNLEVVLALMSFLSRNQDDDDVPPIPPPIPRPAMNSRPGSQTLRFKAAEEESGFRKTFRNAGGAFLQPANPVSYPDPIAIPIGTYFFYSTLMD